MNSQCCNAPLRVEGDETRYYVCTKCNRACDPVSFKMSPEAQRIAIAEECGWTIHVQNGIEFCWNEKLNKTLSPEDDINA